MSWFKRCIVICALTPVICFSQVCPNGAIDLGYSVGFYTSNVLPIKVCSISQVAHVHKKSGIKLFNDWRESKYQFKDTKSPRLDARFLSPLSHLDSAHRQFLHEMPKSKHKKHRKPRLKLHSGNVVPLVLKEPGVTLSSAIQNRESPSLPASVPMILHSSNLWSEMVAQFNLGHPNQPRVDQEVQNYLKHRKTLMKDLSNAVPYLYYVYQQTKLKGLPAEIALLPLIESAYQPRAHSKKGAAGIWQIMPKTALGHHLEMNWWYDGRVDVVASTPIALEYLRRLHKHFNNWPLAIASYNAGPGRIDLERRKPYLGGSKKDFWQLKLPAETMRYVPKLYALVEIVSHPEDYGVKLPNIENHPYFESIDMQAAVPFPEIAKMADMSEIKLHQLNPGFKRQAPQPNHPYVIWLPYGNSISFQKALENHRSTFVWDRYKVRKGESADEIAHHHGASVDKLIEMNGQSNVHEGEEILVPLKYFFVLPGGNGSEIVPLQFTAQKIRHATYIKLKPGDHLWRLAKTYGVSVENIVKWNHLKSSNSPLRVGETLLIFLSKKNKGA